MPAVAFSLHSRKTGRPIIPKCSSNTLLDKVMLHGDDRLKPEHPLALCCNAANIDDVHGPTSN